MKKFNLIMTSLLLFAAMQINAQVSSIADLYGSYKFTANVEFTAEGETYKDVLLAESDATISASGTYDAQIIGFAGAQTPLGINATDAQLSSNTVEMTNPNSPQLWNGLMLANKNGDDPNGVFNNGEWVVMPYNTEYYTFNPETKEISIPDFSVVKSSDKTIIAKYTNVKMVCVSSDKNEGNDTETPENAFDWAGKYTLTAAKVEAWDNGSYPSEFNVTIEYNADWQMYLLTEFMDTNIADLNQGGILLTPAQDGKTATLDPGLLASVGNGDFMKLRDANGQPSPLTLTVNDDGTVSIDDFALMKGAWDSEEGNSAMASYFDVTASKEGQEGGSTPEESFDWTGEYTLSATAMINGETAPLETTFTVIFDATYNMYLVTEILGYDVATVNYGGMLLEIAEDGKSATLEAGYLSYTQDEVLELRDMNLQKSPITLTLNDDGTVSFDNFCSASIDAENKATLVGYYQDAVAAKKGDSSGIENVTTENATAIYDLSGRRVKEITSNGIYIINGKKHLVK